MKAVTFTGAGGNEVVAVRERPDPVPGTDEVVVAGRGLPEIDRVFPAGDVTAAFDHLVQPGKTGKILLDFG